MHNETEVHLPTISSDHIKQQLSQSKITKSNSQLTNNSMKYCNTTPNKSSPNIKGDKKKSVIVNEYHKDEATLKKELNDFLKKHNLPNPDTLIEEMDQVIIDRLKLESKCIERKLIKALMVYYEKDNIAVNAEKDQKTYEEKANELISQRKVLKKKNLQLKEYVSGLTRALGNLNAEVFKLKGTIEEDKQHVIELNDKFDIKIEEEQKKQVKLKTELKYLTLKLENMDDNENEAREKAPAELVQKIERKPLLTEPNKLYKLSHKKLSVKELSDTVIKLRIEIEELKKKSIAFELEKQTLHQQIKVQGKDLNTQQKNMETLALILKEKDKLAHWNKICLKNHKSFTLRQNNNPLTQSSNILSPSLPSP